MEESEHILQLQQQQLKLSEERVMMLDKKLKTVNANQFDAMESVEDQERRTEEMLDEAKKALREQKRAKEQLQRTLDEVKQQLTTREDKATI